MIDFGKKVYSGNFLIMKKVKTLSKKEMARFRELNGTNKEMCKKLSRSGLPYIRVETIGGDWAVEFMLGTTAYDAIEALDMKKDGRGDWRVTGVDGENSKLVFTSMYMDTSVVGDEQYQADKCKALTEYLKRSGEKAVNAMEEKYGPLDVLGNNDESEKEVSDGKE